MYKSSPKKNLYTQDVQHTSYTSFLPLLLIASLLLVRCTSKSTPRPLIIQDNILHTAHIMLRLPHIRQSRSSRPLLSSLYDLDALHIRTVDLIPHLNSNSRQLISQ